MTALDAEWPQTALQWLRLGGNLLNLSSPLGLVLVAAGRARLRRGPRGLWLAEGYRLSFPVAGAFTVGNVIITGSTFEALLAHTPGLVRHEERHSWQWLVCLGLPMLPLYVLSMGWSMLRTGDRAARNIFERAAGLTDGGYADVPVRPWGDLFRRRSGSPLA